MLVAGASWKGAVGLVDIATADEGQPTELIRQGGENAVDVGDRVGDHVDERLRMERRQRSGQRARVSAIGAERHGARGHGLAAAVDDRDVMSSGEEMLRDPGANEAGTTEEKDAHRRVSRQPRQYDFRSSTRLTSGIVAG